jgi:ubiquinone/menaquinone biosynthesis C-methylase UbiE
VRRQTEREELLDGPLDDPAALRGNLRDLARVNRHLGGSALSIRAIEALAGDRNALSVLDVGTGAADIPVALLEHAARTGRDWRVTGVDSRPEVLAAAAALDPRLTGPPGLTLHVGDGAGLAFDDGAFDVAHASLVVHHLDPAGVDALLREMARVARLGVVVNDLVRGRWALAGAWTLTRLATRNRYTRNDAPLSVRRAYTRPELRAMLARADLEVVTEVGGFAGHRWAVAAIPAAGGSR